MRKTKTIKVAGAVLTIALAVGGVVPAEAYYLHVPKKVTDAWVEVSKFNLTQDNFNSLVKDDSSEQFFPGGEQFRQDGQPVPPPNFKGDIDNQNNTAPTDPQGNMPNNQMMPRNFGPNNNDGQMPSGQFQPGGQQGQFGPNNGSGQMPTGPSEEQMNQMKERQMKDMQRGIKQMEMNISRFEKMQKGNLSAEVKEKIKKIKEKIEILKNAKSPEEMQSVDMGEISSDMQSLEEERQMTEMNNRRVEEVKRGLKGMSQGLKSFESQIKKLTKQKISVPQEITDTINKIKTVLDVVKNAKTWDEMETAGIEDVRDLMQNLDEYRQQLEMLAHWPQTIKQVDRQLAMMTKDLKRSKTIVDKLAKKDVDLSAEYSAFEEVVTKLKATREEVVAKVKSGKTEDVQDAFDTLENEFFGQMDDAYQYQRVIMMMSNLGRFNSDFKRSITDGQKQVRALKRQKIDTQELEVMLNDVNEKGKEIKELLKVKPIDEEIVSEVLQELEDLKNQFMDKANELGGEDEDMPWESGPRKFESPVSNFNLNKYFTDKQKPQPSTQPAQPIDSSGGVENVPVDMINQ